MESSVSGQSVQNYIVHPRYLAKAFCNTLHVYNDSGTITICKVYLAATMVRYFLRTLSKIP